MRLTCVVAIIQEAGLLRLMKWAHAFSRPLRLRRGRVFEIRRRRWELFV